MTVRFGLISQKSSNLNVLIHIAHNLEAYLKRDFRWHSVTQVNNIVRYIEYLFSKEQRKIELK